MRDSKFPRLRRIAGEAGGGELIRGHRTISHQLRDGRALDVWRLEAVAFANGWDKVDGLDRAIDRDILPNAGSECEQPGGAGHGAARALMLEAIAARIAVRVASEIRHDEQ